MRAQPLSPGKRNWYKRSEYHGIPCYHIVVPPKKGSMIQRIRAYLKFHLRALQLVFTENIKADVLLSQSPPLSVGLINGILARMLRAKGIYIVQDLFPDGQIEQGKIKSKLLIALIRCCEHTVYKLNQAIVAISAPMRDILSSRVPRHHLLEVIPNFVDTDLYHPLPYRNEYRNKFELSENSFIISYVGNIGNAHDLSPILYAAEKLSDLDIKFVVAGDGIKRQYYEEQERGKNLQNIVWLGYQKREETPYINAFSDLCLVLLAEHIKGYSFPSKTYTLMAMGKPILAVCSNACPVKQFLEESQCGWSFDCGEYDRFTAKIQELYHNRGLLEETGRNGLIKVQQEYTKDRIGNLYYNLIENLLQK